MSALSLRLWDVIKFLQKSCCYLGSVSSAALKIRPLVYRKHGICINNKMFNFKITKIKSFSILFLTSFFPYPTTMASI
jgi:hypothetical protein